MNENESPLATDNYPVGTLVEVVNPDYLTHGLIGMVVSCEQAVCELRFDHPFPASERRFALASSLKKVNIQDIIR